MMERSSEEAWAMFGKAAARADALLPELDGEVGKLVQDLVALRRILNGQRCPDRRLFGIDLSNLAHSLDAAMAGSCEEVAPDPPPACASHMAQERDRPESMALHD